MANSLTKIKTNAIDDDAVTLAKQAAGTDGQIITYDASGNPTAVGPGTDGQVLTSTGAGSPPAFEAIPAQTPEGTAVLSTGESGGTKFLREDGDGTSSWQSVPAAGAALTGSTNNTITTVTGANAIQGEANLTFDGNDLTQTITSSGGQTLTSTGNHAIRITANTDRAAENNTLLALRAQWNDTQVAMIDFQAGDDTTNKDNSKIAFYTAPAGTQEQHMLIESNGNVKINDGDLVIGTAGHGIDFSATADGQTSPSELLDDYEQGTWDVVPTTESGSLAFNSSVNTGAYVKVGSLVHISVRVAISSVSSASGYLRLSLPFATSNAGPDQSWASIFPMFTSNVNLPANTVSTMGEPWHNVSYVNFLAQYDDGLWAAVNSNVFDASGSEYISFTTTYITDA